MGTFFKDSALNSEPYVLDNKQWSEISQEMEAVKKSIPTDFGRPPRNILLHHNGYKAVEWASWIMLYSLPLLKGRLPEHYLRGWSYFVKAVCLCQKRKLSAQDQDDIKNFLLEFYNHYERYAFCIICHQKSH